jgi:hypothetical protein
MLLSNISLVINNHSTILYDDSKDNCDPYGIIGVGMLFNR